MYKAPIDKALYNATIKYTQCLKHTRLLNSQRHLIKMICKKVPLQITQKLHFRANQSKHASNQRRDKMDQTFVMTDHMLNGSVLQVLGPATCL